MQELVLVCLLHWSATRTPVTMTTITIIITTIIMKPTCLLLLLLSTTTSITTKGRSVSGNPMASPTCIFSHWNSSVVFKLFLSRCPLEEKHPSPHYVFCFFSLSNVFGSKNNFYFIIISQIVFHNVSTRLYVYEIKQIWTTLFRKIFRNKVLRKNNKCIYLAINMNKSICESSVLSQY